MNPVYYHWKTEEFPDKNFTDQRQIGFIAQDIEKLFPELVLTDAEGYKSVDYSKITPVLVQALKEQNKEIVSLKEQNAAILKRLEKIETKAAKQSDTAGK